MPAGWSALFGKAEKTDAAGVPWVRTGKKTEGRMERHGSGVAADWVVLASGQRGWWTGRALVTGAPLCSLDHCGGDVDGA